MALTRTNQVGAISIDGHGTGAFTTGSFTPPDNSLLVVFGGAMDVTGAVNLDTALTMDGGGLTYTRRVNVEAGAASAFSIASVIWTAPVTTGASMTLSLDAGTRNLQFATIQAAAYTGYDTGTPVGGTGTTTDTVSPDGAQSITLSAAPTTDDEAFGGMTLDKEDAGVTPGAAFTELYDLQVAATGGGETEIRTNSTSTTVDWVDTWPGGGNIFKISAVALVIKASGGGGGGSGDIEYGPYPTIPTSGASRILSSANLSPAGTHTFPSLSSLTKNVNDLLIALCIQYDGNSTNAEFSSWGGGFTEFVDQATTATMAIGAAYKWSTGAETGTFTVTSADTSTNDSQCLLLSIAGAHKSTVPEGGTIANGTGAAANPGSLALVGWGAENTLWIAVCGAGETATTGAFDAPSAAPTDYGNLFVTTLSADVVGGVYGAVAFRQLNAASEDVGAFTVDVSNARNSALLLAVRPEPSLVTPLRRNMEIPPQMMVSVR